MMEVGPWRTDHKGGYERVEGGWEEYTTMVYSACTTTFPFTTHKLTRNSVDQPAGTGFSYTASNKYLHELSEVSTRASS